MLDANLLPEAIARLGVERGGERYLSDHHLLAAQKLSLLFARAQLQQRVTMSYDPTRIGGGGGRPVQGEMALSVAQVRAQLNALARDLPNECWAILSDTCCFDLGLQEIEAKHAWPRRGAKLVLRIALEQLAQRWGLSSASLGEGAGVKTWLPERPAMFLD